MRELNTNKTLYLMCLPALLLLFLLCYLPFGGIWMAFTDFNALDGVFGSPFVGLRNFSIFFKQLTAWNVVKNTLIINFFGIILGLIVPISLAIFLNEMRLGIYKRVVQSVMFFPYFLSWVVVGAIVYGLLATDVGVVNNVLKSMDMEPVRWFAEPKYWKTILIAANVWKWSGYNSIVYLAAITNFDPNLFEAAPGRRGFPLPTNPAPHHPHAEAHSSGAYSSERGPHLLRRLRYGIRHCRGKPDPRGRGKRH